MNTKSSIANDPLSSSWAARIRAELRSYALSHLPKAMVPAHFVFLPDLPELPNGKVDRTQLPQLEPAPATAERVAARSELEEQIARIWQEVLGTKNVGVETSFFEVGGDSLTMLQVSAKIAEAYGVRIDLAKVLAEPTVASFARAVKAMKATGASGGGGGGGLEAGAAGGTGAATEAGIASGRSLSAEELKLEAVLPADVIPDADALPVWSGELHTILATGGTGYTGAFLVRELLDRSTATICVVARAEDSREAALRVLANLEDYGLLQVGDADRIEGVAGDMSRPYLGMSREVYGDLAARVQLIIHNAADSSWTQPFHRLKPVNILGSLEVLRLACRKRIKPVHYVCSIAVYPGLDGESVGVERELPSPAGVVGGYRQTKWATDQLMHRARERGIPTYVYRMGALVGASTTGACSTDTFINDLIKACIQLGAAMDYDLQLELVPVDHCARVVAQVALAPAVQPGTFNVPGARPVSMNEVVDLLIAYGYPLERLPYRAWYERFTQAIERGEENQLARYLALFGQDRPAPEIGYPGARPRFETTERDRALALAGSDERCPPVTLELFRIYLDYFVAIGFLPPPPAAEASAPRTIP
jgi:thioester reductase-like protein